MPVGSNQPHRPRFLRRELFGAVAAGAAFLFLIVNFDFGQILQTASLVSTPALMVASAAIMAGLLISCLRYQWALSSLGLRVPFGPALQANLIGIVGGLLFFQLLGQTVARTAMLTRYGLGGAAVLLANVYERITALLSLAALALFALIYLYRGVTIDVVGAAGLIKIGIALGVTVLAVASTAARPISRLLVRNTVRMPMLVGISKVGVCSIWMHLSTLAAYVALAHAFAPTIDLVNLSAASLIVMFAAALPISFAGWGIREISAVYAYGTIGIGADQALATSILIGALSLACLAIVALAAHVGHFLPRIARTASERIADKIAPRSAELTRGLSVLIPLIAGLLVFFQVYVPTDAGKINLNLADPIAIGGAIVFLSLYGRKSERWRIWKIDRFETMLIIASGAMLVGFLIGWARFGVTDWALYNRLIGWFVLLSYLATGALIVGVMRTIGLTVFLRVLLITGIATASLDLALLLLAGFNVRMAAFLLQDTTAISGMSQNANAFALQLTIVLAIASALQSGGRLSGSGINTKPFIAVLAIILLAIIFAKSRTGYITVAVMLCVVAWVRWVHWQSVLIAGLLTLILAFLPLCLHAAGELIWNGIIPGYAAVPLIPAPKILSPPSDAERWFTITHGIELWLKHPIFGAGLGAFVHAIEDETGTFLVIHDSTVWLLAEFGIVGTAIFVGGFLILLRTAWSEAQSGSLSGRALLLVLLSFALFQTSHDVFFQRIFWLLLGATLIQAGSLRDAVRSSR